MARPTYSDLFLTFTPSASTTPSMSYLNNIIETLFYELFNIAHKDYVDGSTATDDEIDTNDVYAIVKREASMIAENIMKYSAYNPVERPAGSFPIIALSETGKKLFMDYLVRKRGNLIENIRVWGSDTRDS